MSLAPEKPFTGLTRCTILYEDSSLLVVDKPSGFLSHPNPSSSRRAERRNPFAAFEGRYYYEDRRFDTPQGPIWLIHRLDQDASGVLLAARSQEAARKCRTAFERFQVLKIYSVLARGRFPQSRGIWKDSISEKRHGGWVRSRVTRRGRPNAELSFTLKKYCSQTDLALLEVQPVTGRTHQIRVQCASHGHPIAGDAVYGHFPWNRELKRRVGLKRIFLHAAILEIRHPATGKPLRIESPLPPELNAVLTRLS